jgi:hypothetical protein
LSLEKLHPAGSQTVAGMLAKGWIVKEVDAGQDLEGADLLS